MKIKLLVLFLILAVLFSSCTGENKISFSKVQTGGLQINYYCTEVGVIDYCKVINSDNSVCYLAIGGSNTVALDCLEDK